MLYSDENSQKQDSKEKVARFIERVLLVKSPSETIRLDPSANAPTIPCIAQLPGCTFYFAKNYFFSKVFVVYESNEYRLC
jgi:hypothetical protein